MTALKVFFIVFLILWAVLCIRVGGTVEYSKAGLFVWMRVGRIQITLFPLKPKEKKKAAKSGGKKVAKPEKKEPETQEKRGGMLGLIRAMLPLLLDTANRFRKKIRIAPLEVLLTIPGLEDPARSAVRYGQANAMLGSVWPALNRAFDIRDSRIGTRVNFEEEDVRVYMKAGVSIRIGQALWIGVRFAVAGLVQFIQYRGKNRKKESSCGKQSSN